MLYSKDCLPACKCRCQLFCLVFSQIDSMKVSFMTANTKTNNSNSSKQMLAGSVWSLSERTVLICWYRQSRRTKWELRNAKFKMLSYCDLCAFYWQSCSSSPVYPLWPGYWCNTGTVSCSSVLLNDGWNNCCYTTQVNSAHRHTDWLVWKWIASTIHLWAVDETKSHVKV